MMMLGDRRDRNDQSREESTEEDDVSEPEADEDEFPF
jgi:hypothetical protein